MSPQESRLTQLAFAIMLAQTLSVSHACAAPSSNGEALARKSSAAGVQLEALKAHQAAERVYAGILAKIAKGEDTYDEWELFMNADKAAELAPKNHLYKQCLIKYLSTMGNYNINREYGLASALSSFERLVTLDPQNTNARQKLIECQAKVQLEKKKEAEKLAQLARDVSKPIAKGDEHAVIDRNNVGVRLLDSGDFQNAIRAFEAAVNADPTYERARKNLAIAKSNYGLQLSKSDYSKALRCFHEAYAIDSTNAVTKRNIEGAIRMLGHDPKSADGCNKVGDLVRVNGDFTGAIYQYKQALSYKDDPAVWEKLGDCYRVRDENNNALEAYKRALQTKNSALLHVKLGQAHLAMGETANGIAEFQNAQQLGSKDPDVLDALENGWAKAVEANPMSPDNHIGLGMSNQLKGNFEAAEFEYKQAILVSKGGMNPTAEDLIARLGDAKAQHILNSNSASHSSGTISSGTPLSTSTTAQTTPSPSSVQIAAAPASPIVTQDQVGALVAQGKYSDAATVLDVVLKRTPLDTKAWYNYGICKQALKDYHGALAAYEMVATLDANNTEAKVAAETVKKFLTQQDEKKKADAAVLAAKKKTREDLFKAISVGKYKESTPTVNEELKADPKDFEMWYLLGICKHGTQDYHGALAAYEMTTRLLPGDHNAQSALDGLKNYLNGKSAIAPAAPTNPKTSRRVLLDEKIDTGFDF